VVPVTSVLATRLFSAQHAREGGDPAAAVAGEMQV